MIPMRARASWRERAYDAALAVDLTAAGLSPVLARLLAARGIGKDEMEEFFDPSIRRLSSPSGLTGVDEAVKVIAPFVHTERKIIVFGDYDADGVCASAIMVSALRGLGANADAFIPERMGEATA